MVLFCSFLVNFTNLSWKEFNINNINILSRIVLLLVFCFFVFSYSCFFVFFFCFCLFVWFLGWGGGGISIHEKDRGLRQHTINYICTSLLHLGFPFPPTLIVVSECDVLWTATCAVISLVGSVKSRF